MTTQTHRKILHRVALMMLALSIFFSCSKKEKETAFLSKEDKLNVILSNITDNHSIVDFNNIQATVEFSFEEYNYGTLIYSEELGKFEIGKNSDTKSPFIVTTILSDLENGYEYCTFLFSSEGSNQEKRIFRKIPKGSLVAQKGTIKVFQDNFSEEEYLISVSSYSDSSASTSAVSDKKMQIDKYQNIHLVKMKVLD